MQLEYCSAVLVDKNNFQRKLLRSLLRTSGFHRIFETDSFEGGLTESKRSSSDFLFIDYDTARQSDLLRVASNIPRQHLARHTRLIMLMDNPTQPRVKTAIDIGSHWVLSRPFSPQTLDRRIRAVLDPGSLIKITPDSERRSGKDSEDATPASGLLNEMDDLLRSSQYFSVKPAEPAKITRKPTSSVSKTAPKHAEPEEDIFLL
ncbi:MAG TPA: hypothetical protein DCS30_02925 [Rhizobiales bacterium]|nr:hypothetical protein [Hyphomicrobiales bacterium]